MPTVALHSNYWATAAAGGGGDPIGASAGASFTSWQTTVISQGGFGVSVALWAMVVILPMAK